MMGTINTWVTWFVALEWDEQLTLVMALITVLGVVYKIWQWLRLTRDRDEYARISRDVVVLEEHIAKSTKQLNSAKNAIDALKKDSPAELVRLTDQNVALLREWFEGYAERLGRYAYVCSYHILDSSSSASLIEPVKKAIISHACGFSGASGLLTELAVLHTNFWRTQGQTDLAEIACQDAIDAFIPKSLRNIDYIDLGNKVFKLHDQGRYLEASILWRKVIRMIPFGKNGRNVLTAHNNYAYCLDNLGRYQEAENEYREVR